MVEIVLLFYINCNCVGTYKINYMVILILIE